MSFLQRFFPGRARARHAWILSASLPAAEAALGRLPGEARARLGTHPHCVFGVASSTELETPARLDGDGQAAVSVFAPLADTRFEIIVIGRELRLLIGGDFTLAWLAGLCSRLGPRDALYLELPQVPPGRPHDPRLRIDDIEARSDLFEVRVLERNWLSVTLSREFRVLVEAEGLASAARPRLDTIAPRLLSSWPAFAERYRSAHSGYVDPERLRPEFAARQFVYTLHGTAQKAHFLEWAARARGLNRPLRILDMGGGYGAMAAELAVRGHTVTVVELERAKIESLGHWISALAAVEDRLEFVAGNFDAIEQIAGPFDVISFFGSLLYYPHDRCPDLLRRCSERLAPDGLLVVHENPKERATPEAVDYDNQFFADELHDAVSLVFDDVRYYSIFDYREIDLPSAAQRLLLMVASPMNDRP